MSTRKPKTVQFKGGHKPHPKKKKHPHSGADNSQLAAESSGSRSPLLTVSEHGDFPDGGSGKPGDSGISLQASPGGAGNLLHPDTAANVYDHVGRGRRRSSVMIEYYRDNYMDIKSGDVTDKHLQDIKDTFELLDRDKDGKLSLDEISNLLRYIGSLKSDTEMEEMLAPIDIDHNGAISFEEFKKFIIEKDVLKSLADEVCYEMQDAFNMFDKDGNGYIDRDELKRVLTSIGDKMPDELADEFIREADLNGDGKIDYKEFCKHMGY